jgi:hypothetical protein
MKTTNHGETTMTTKTILDLTSDDSLDVDSSTPASRALTKREINELNYSFGREDEPDVGIGTVADLSSGDTAWVFDAGMGVWWLSEIK